MYRRLDCTTCMNAQRKVWATFFSSIQHNAELQQFNGNRDKLIEWTRTTCPMSIDSLSHLSEKSSMAVEQKCRNESSARTNTLAHESHKNGIT